MKKEILSTLIYADIFDYPLSETEVWHFLISPREVSQNQISLWLSRLVGKGLLEKSGDYYCLPGRKKIIGVRRRRLLASRRKMIIANKIGKWLCLIPTIKMVAVTGALTMDNARVDDDIDLLIVSSSGTLWLTRLFSVFLLEILGCRRRPSERSHKDRICLNMFLDEGSLAISLKRQNLFTAHEVSQLRLLRDRGGTYSRFLSENRWLGKYLANISIGKIADGKKINRRKRIGFFEFLAYRLQLAYMSKRRTIEVAEEGLAMFHPGDVSCGVLENYHNRLKKYRIT